MAVSIWRDNAEELNNFFSLLVSVMWLQKCLKKIALFAQLMAAEAMFTLCGYFGLFRASSRSKSVYLVLHWRITYAVPPSPLFLHRQWQAGFWAVSVNRRLLPVVSNTLVLLTIYVAFAQHRRFIPTHRFYWLMTMYSVTLGRAPLLAPAVGGSEWSTQLAPSRSTRNISVDTMGRGGTYVMYKTFCSSE